MATVEGGEKTVKFCETCKWWAANNDSQTGWATTRRPYFFCSHPQVRLSKPTGDDGLVAADWLIATGPKFGCVHHEEKTE